MALINKLENIANAIRAKSGKTAKMTLDQMATEIANISTGTDTSDANAVAANIEKDKTAYVKGVKVTGTVPMYSGINMTYDANNTAVSSTNLNVRGLRTSGKVILENNGYAATPVPLSAFGTATPADVAAGKTFTSASGWKAVGTKVDSGGGGGTIGMVMKTGTVNLSATAENLVIETGLSSVNAIIIYHAQPTSTSSTYGWDMSFDANIGKILYRSYGQYLSYNYGLNNTSAVTANGGTVTAKQYSTSYPVISGDFTWVAYGYE